MLKMIFNFLLGPGGPGGGSGLPFPEGNHRFWADSGKFLIFILALSSARWWLEGMTSTRGSDLLPEALKACLTFRLIFYFFGNFENFGPTGNRSDWLGDPVPGPWGPILGPREWVWRGLGTPQKP